MPLLESGEMYLETILKLQEEKGSVRSIDVATEMGFSKASISRAMGMGWPSSPRNRRRSNNMG